MSGEIQGFACESGVALAVFAEGVGAIAVLGACTGAGGAGAGEGRTASGSGVDAATSGPSVVTGGAAWAEAKRANNENARPTEELHHHLSDMPTKSITDTTPACDFIDPMNVYGDHSAAKLLGKNAFARFHATAEDLQQCLGSDTPVVVRTVIVHG